MLEILKIFKGLKSLGRFWELDEYSIFYKCFDYFCLSSVIDIK